MGKVFHSFMITADCLYPLLRLTLQDGAQIYFLPDRPQLTGPKGEPMDGEKTSLTEPCQQLRLPGIQMGEVFSMKVSVK